MPSRVCTSAVKTWPRVVCIGPRKPWGIPRPLGNSKLFTLRPPRRGQARCQRPNFEISFRNWVFWAENSWIFSGFFRRSFCTYRELRKPKSDHAHPGFVYFFPFLTPQKSHETPGFPLSLKKPFPWDHAQMIERKILFRIALTRALYDQIRP